MAAKPVTFGVLTLPNVPWQQLADQWRLIDELGFDSVWDCDHFVNPYSIDEPWFEGWTALAALAANTTRIRIGSLVTTITYRNPAVLAREVLTVDHISGGRLDLAIGAGGAPADASMTGIDVWEPAERVARFREFVEIVDALLRGNELSYSGRYYRTNAAKMNPATVQQPRPPLTLAAEGPKALALVAERADRWVTFGLHARSGVSDSSALTGHVCQRNRDLDELAAAQGRDPNSISQCLLVGLTLDQPFASIDAFTEFVGRYQEAGISEFIVYWCPEALRGSGFYQNWDQRFASTEMLERIATKVFPQFRRIA